MTAASVAGAQTWSAASYDKNARFVSDLAGDVLGWLDAQPRERILDLGCGDGVLTEHLAKNDASVVGVDSSEDFVAAARARGVDARIGDGEALAFDAEFDAVFSNAALHWMTKPEAVIDGVFRALKPGGRFVAEFGGHGNVAAIVTALRAVGQARGGDLRLANPWFFPTPAEYRTMLEARGLAVERIGLYPRPTPLPTGMAGWLSTFRAPFFDQFGKDREAAVSEVEALLGASLRDRSGNWTADYVRIRVHASKPAAA
ncbi:methyltransferase type 11 [Agaricicola taiwanensis]|uniref:Methyltransferase type 11 n=1 Tax=Agaricicola taiwanensis TaxID=591372 RepID=A0A8J2YHT9_9RHOB|nr:class I SAM-dependent methyltransferase [Agaricicola taiwanensis]GGE43704.1 methyltransferase type 11 [Agaricicola taiwanensis]